MSRRSRHPNRPLVLAHRGASAQTRDNSLEAFRLAAEQGADGIEFDARFTSDGVVVIHHDAVIAGFGALVDRPFAALRSSHPHVPTLDETLAVSGDLMLNIEIKNGHRDPDYDPEHRMATAIVEWVQASRVAERVLVTSFNAATVKRVKLLGPSIPTGVLLRDGRGIRRKIREAAAEGHEWLLPRKTALNTWAINVARLVDESGLQLGTWTVDSPKELRRMRRIGVDAVITSDPETALRVYG